MQKTRVGYRTIGIALVFCSGVLLGAFFPQEIVRAQRQTSSEDSESAREAFLRGGDRSYAVLRDIRVELQENTRVLQEISATERRIERSLERNLSGLSQQD